jgi:hypothetical protein
LQRNNYWDELGKLEQSKVMVDMCLAMWRLNEAVYPGLREFSGLDKLCIEHFAQYPHAPPPFEGPAAFQYFKQEFEDQDQ